MTSLQWKAFSRFRDIYKEQCSLWEAKGNSPSGWLKELQEKVCFSDGTPMYPLETTVVYNKSLDEISETDHISLILVGDNPGKNEQLAVNRRYLVGLSGKLGDRFFRLHPELGIDFRKNVIILNKTPIHTAKTKQLGQLLKIGGEKFRTLYNETQQILATETATLQHALDCQLWLVGYGELRSSGLFSVYAKEIGTAYAQKTSAPVRLYQHFSMNRFTIDLSAQTVKNPSMSLQETLESTGLAHRKEILGW